MTVKSYRDLDAWKLGIDYVVAIYSLTGKFAREDEYGLTSQLRRASVAIPSARVIYKGRVPICVT